MKKMLLKRFVSRLTLVLALSFCTASLSAQTKVSGVVIDSHNEPVIGATILVKGTSVGTITDIDGKYAVTVPAGSKQLVFSYIGMATQEVAVKAGTVNVTLKEDAILLEEFVAIGYGVQAKRDLTGSVASVGEKMLRNIPVTTAAEAITGRLVGVQVTTSEGSPDAEISIRVRGGGSISQDNSPLYIVDGFPVSSISNIAPSDIENIVVLKDASSTAIYGARGANGVIEVTTKSGKEGKVTVSFNAYGGVKQITKYLPVMNPYEYVMYQYELDPSSTFNKYYGAFGDLDIYKSDAGRNWQKDVFGQTGVQQYYNLSISGGSKISKFNLSLTRNDEKSIMIGSDYERNNINFKSNTTINNNLSVDFNARMAYTLIDGAGVSSGAGANTRLRNAVKYAPTRGLRGFSNEIDDDELLSPESSSLLYDPIESVIDDYKRQRRFSNNYNAALNWKIIKGLTFRSEWGYEFNFDKTDEVSGPATSKSRQYAGKPIASVRNYESAAWRITNTLTWDKKNLLPQQNLNLMIGQEATSSSSKSITSESRFFPLGMTPDDMLAKMNMGTPIPTISRYSQPNNLASFFGRANYSALDRYLLTLVLRADGSSKFAPGNQWGVFPSAAFAWRASEESFMKNLDVLSNLKFRLSLGTAGNNRIEDGLWQTQYSTDAENKPYYPNESEASQLIPGKILYNPKLKWETTITRNIGVDYGFMNNRLSGAVDVYWNTTKDLLVQAPIPANTGYDFQMRNIGQTSNMGIEFTLDAVIIDQKNFALNASFNIAFNRNRVEKFANGDNNWKAYTSGWNGSSSPIDDYIVREGEPLGQMYGYVYDGMYTFDDFTFDATANNGAGQWQLKAGVPNSSALLSSSYFGPGAMKLKDLDGKAGLTEGDKQVIGNALPIHTGGFNLSARVYNWDLGAFFNWSYGNDVYNANKIDYSCYLQTRKYQNLSAEMGLNNRFTIVDPVDGSNISLNPGRLAEVNQNASVFSPLFTTPQLTSWAIEDGSFLRLNNVTIGYTIPNRITKKALIENVRLYVTGYNLFTFTNYSGFDPEVSTRRSTPLTPSVDYSAYPRSRSYVAGINVTF